MDPQSNITKYKDVEWSTETCAFTWATRVRVGRRAWASVKVVFSMEQKRTGRTTFVSPFHETGQSKRASHDVGLTLSKTGTARV